MNRERRNKILDYGAFGGYLIVGIITRYLLIPYCTPLLTNFHIIVGWIVAPLIIFGVGGGLASFFLPKIRGSTFFQSMLAGFGGGVGLVTIASILVIHCI